MTPETTAHESPDRVENTVRASLLTAEQVGEMLAVPTTWVLRAAREGRIPHVRLGTYVRFRPSAIAAWLEDQERTP